MLDRLAMDAEAMTDDLGFLLAGAVAGAIYFALLRWNTALYSTGASGRAIGLHLARLGGLGGLLTAVALLGALPLLLCALGVLLVRPLVMRVMP